ncbi:MAG: DMT family transporter [Chloroflexota bacterium]
MSGIFLSIISGVGIGLFHALNRRAAYGIDPFQATFILLFVSSAVLIAISLLTIDLALLTTAPPIAFVYFILAAVIHFLVGWTLFNMSQKSVGAARTGVLLGTDPLWGTAIGAIFFSEFLSGIILLGIILMIIGAYVVSSDKPNNSNTEIQTGAKASLYGLGAAVCFAASSIFIRYGLDFLLSPLLGVTIGISVVTVIYGLLLWGQVALNGKKINFGRLLWLQIVGGVLVALATWWRWMAFDLVPIAVVIALSRLSIPTVLILSPFVIGQKLENVNGRVWLGAVGILAGAMILTFILVDRDFMKK